MIRVHSVKNDPAGYDGTYHMAPHEKTIIDTLHSPASKDPDMTKAATQKENHDPELEEIASKEFGKVS